jgi:hypothetical protein
VVIRTTDGQLVYSGPSGNGLEVDEATADAADRNKRAEEMGLSVRYEAVEK